MRNKLILAAAMCLVPALTTMELPVSAQDATPAQTEYWVSVPACAFHEYTVGEPFNRRNTLWFSSSLSTTSHEYFAPLNLPHGSTVKKILLICSDGDEAKKIILTLRRTRQDGTFNYIESVASTSSIGGYQMYPKALTTKKYVNTWKFSYYLNLYIEGPDLLSFSQAKLLIRLP